MKRGIHPSILLLSILALALASGCGNGGFLGPGTGARDVSPADRQAINASVRGFLDCLAGGDLSGAQGYLSPSARESYPDQFLVSTLYFRDFGSDIHNPVASDVASYPLLVLQEGITFQSPDLARLTAVSAGAGWSSVCFVFSLMRDGDRWLIENLEVNPYGCGTTPAEPAVPAVLTITGVTSLTATNGVAVLHTFTATGGTRPYTWTLVGGALPPGLSVSLSGSLTGTPTVAGVYNFTLQVQSADGQSVQQAYTQTIL